MQLIEIKDWLEKLKDNIRWPFDDASMEYNITVGAARTSFFAGFLVSGILGQIDALNRFNSYSAGKDYGNARNALVQFF